MSTLTPAQRAELDANIRAAARVWADRIDAWAWEWAIEQLAIEQLAIDRLADDGGPAA